MIPNPDSLDTSGRYGVEDSNVITNQEKVNEAKSQVAMLRSKAEQLEGMQWEDLMRASGQLNLNDPIIQSETTGLSSCPGRKGEAAELGSRPQPS